MSENQTNLSKRDLGTKVLFQLKAAKADRQKALNQLLEWAALPQHKWIPIESLIFGNFGYMTDRQARWIESQLKRLEIKVEFETITQEQIIAKL